MTRFNIKLSQTTSLPLTMGQLLRRENISAKSAIPADVETQMATENIYVSDTTALNVTSLTARDQQPTSVRIILPENAFLGLPVQTAEFLTPKTMKKDSEAMELPAFVPGWIPNILHPKHTPAASRPMLRSYEGKEIVPEALFSPESRNTFFPQGYPWHCIGRLFVWHDARAANWSTSGTAVMVGSRVVLTCSHLLPFGSPSWKCLFVPGYFNGAPVTGIGGTSWVSDFRGFRFELEDQAFDMAILRLYDPIGSSIGFLGAKVYNSSWQDQPYWTLVGYPRDIANAEIPSYEQGIRVLGDDADGDFLEIEHRGDTSEGTSGGPLFGIWSDNLPYVIGIHSGYEYHSFPDYENHNVAAGGKGMVDLIHWARNTWP